MVCYLIIYNETFLTKILMNFILLSLHLIYYYIKSTIKKCVEYVDSRDLRIIFFLRIFTLGKTYLKKF